jgi:hypothetical protein
MSDQNFNPWWKHVNDYLQFEERQEFLRGAMGYRPNNKQEAMLSLLLAGYTNQKFDIPKSLGSRNDSKS